MIQGQTTRNERGVIKIQFSLNLESDNTKMPKWEQITIEDSGSELWILDDRGQALVALDYFYRKTDACADRGIDNHKRAMWQIVIPGNEDGDRNGDPWGFAILYPTATVVEKGA